MVRGVAKPCEATQFDLSVFHVSGSVDECKPYVVSKSKSCVLLRVQNM